MSTRRLRLTIVASFCGLTCVLTSGVAPTVAGASQFGESGEQSGQLNGPTGVGVDQATEDVYVADSFNSRIDKFDGSGSFLLAWGWSVNPEAEHDELQTCTTACQRGSGGSGAGQFNEEVRGVTVDNDPLSASYGDVYVFDRRNLRVEKFGPSGNFILMFGGGVNAKTGGNVCLAGEECTLGSEGAANGEFEPYDLGSYIEVGPGGDVYVGDKARIQVFESSGVWREDISLAGLSSTGRVAALAVGSTGDMYVADSGVSGVHEFEPDGVEVSALLDAGSTSVEAIALNGSGDLFVGDGSGGFHVLEYDPAGKEIDSFGSKTAASTSGMAFSNTLNALYVSNYSTEEADIWMLPAPAPGPLIEPASEAAKPGERGTATLEATVNPEGAETTYRFEYAAEAQFNEKGYAGASSTSAVSIGSSFEDQAASAGLTGLVPGGIYHYRVLATNSKGTVMGPDETVTTVAAALVEGPWAANVAGTSATLAARIDPLGAGTEYQLEYGLSTAYGQTLSGSVGAGRSYVPISYHRQGLLPGTTYHYRIVIHNEVGTVQGTDRTFTTQVAGGQELTLPDGRAWELVSPPDKSGAAIEIFEAGEIQAAGDGSAITYVANAPVGENAKSYVDYDQTLSVRGPGGWSSEDISSPHALPEGESAAQLGEASVFEDRFFSTDLSSVLVDPEGDPEGSTATTLSPEATEWTLFLRDDTSGSYQPLLTTGDVRPSGRKFGGGLDPQEFLASTPDLSHVVFGSLLALTPEAVPVVQTDNTNTGRNLYEWSAGQLQLVNILPTGKTTGDEEGASLGGNGHSEIGGILAHAVSSDGRWIVWHTTNGSQSVKLYVRDMLEKKTVEVGGQEALFQTMSSDGSRIFFLERGELYEFDTATDTQTDITADHGAGEESAGVRNNVLGAGEDGSDVYFVASGVLADRGVKGADNLYVSHDDDGWSTTLIATLSSADEHSWFDPYGLGENNQVQLRGVSSRVSPDGHFLTFMSGRSLTGYDNTDAVSGEPDEEVYLYDAISGRLVCTSCNPTGARPVGVLDVDSEESHVLSFNQTLWGGQWLAGSVPGWRETDERALYQPRYLSNSGRLFFESPDALVPQDTNGLEDVYEYEPAGVGSCESTDITFSERSGGCVNLISSGTSSSESAFLDASEDGDDAFFITTSRLNPADYDTNLDVYDAHVCSSTAPCVTVPVAPPACTSGDSCKAAPSPQPAIFGPPASATFSGSGNIVEEPKAMTVKPKAKVKVKRKRHAKKRGRKAKRAGKSRVGRTSGKDRG
jgi:hypothetical protein